jgi:esterase/lipase
MTSTNALLIDARFKDCRMEVRVVGLDLGGVVAAVLDSAGIQMKRVMF